jgi:hypothetical protein
MQDGVGLQKRPNRTDFFGTIKAPAAYECFDVFAKEVCGTSTAIVVHLLARMPFASILRGLLGERSVADSIEAPVQELVPANEPAHVPMNLGWPKTDAIETWATVFFLEEPLLVGHTFRSQRLKFSLPRSYAR